LAVSADFSILHPKSPTPPGSGECAGVINTPAFVRGLNACQGKVPTVEVNRQDAVKLSSNCLTDEAMSYINIQRDQERAEI
jgi:hypothetical protein